MNKLQIYFTKKCTNVLYKYKQYINKSLYFIFLNFFSNKVYFSIFYKHIFYFITLFHYNMNFFYKICCLLTGKHGGLLNKFYLSRHMVKESIMHDQLNFFRGK